MNCHRSQKSEAAAAEDAYGFTPNWPEDSESRCGSSANYVLGSISRDDYSRDSGDEDRSWDESAVTASWSHLRVLPHYETVLLTDATHSHTYWEATSMGGDSYYPVPYPPPPPAPRVVHHHHHHHVQLCYEDHGVYKRQTTTTITSTYEPSRDSRGNLSTLV